MVEKKYKAYIDKVNHNLGILNLFLAKKNLYIQKEPDVLVFVEMDYLGRFQRMEKNAAASWKKMKEAAKKDEISLNIVSAFRSVQEQVSIIERKLSKGMLIENILKINAAPGYSEHHTGQAVDISDGIHNNLTEAFEDSKAFDWLKKNAETYNFKLSFPKNNTLGIAYEPWHWRYCDV